ncbi:MAG: hypothetical protein ACJAUY_001633 [Cognaticolwellia sp.]|jgi:hypothetical protein
MRDIFKPKRRGLGNQLKSLLEENAELDSAPITIPKLDSRHECYAVIRSKGGSGEMHTTKKLIEDLQAKNKYVLVCYENEIDKDHYYTKYFPNGCNSFLKTTLLLSICSTGLLNRNWTNANELADLIHSANESPRGYSIIFTCGTSSGGKFIERISPISDLCKTVYISVNSKVENSILPATYLNDVTELDLKKIKVSWWYSPEPNIHKMAVFPLSHLNQFTKDKLDNSAIFLEKISLI